MSVAQLDFPSVVAEAKHACRDYIDSQLELYCQRQEKRTAMGLPVLDFTGHGRCGKDTSAQFFAELVPGVSYGGSTSNIICPLIAHAMRISEEECFEHRHDDRQFWKDFCDEFRKADHSLLCRMSLGRGDVLVGTRGWLELKAGVIEGVIDFPVWINRNAVPVDPTMDYDAGDVLTFPDWRWIDNNGTLDDLRLKVRKIAESVL